MKSLIVLLLVVSFMSVSFAVVKELDNDALSQQKHELEQQKYRLEGYLDYALNDFQNRCINSKHPTCRQFVTMASK